MLKRLFSWVFGFMSFSGPVQKDKDSAYLEKQLKPVGKESSNKECSQTMVSQPSLVITPEMLEKFYPINYLANQEHLCYALDTETLSMCSGSVVFQQGEPIDSLYYLLEGSVLLHIKDEKICRIDSGTTAAQFPLCSGRRFSVSASALTAIQVVRLSPELIIKGSSADAVAFDPTDPLTPQEIQENPLFQDFCAVYLGKELQMPTLPIVAIKMRRALEAENLRISQIAEIVQMEPAIAVKLVQIANSLLYSPLVPVTNCHEAISYIGTAATSRLVIGQSLRQIFDCPNVRIRRLLREEWRKSIYLSSLCWVLASENGDVKPEDAQLAGLVCDIGNVPFLAMLAHIEGDHLNEENISLIQPYIAPKLGVQVLKSWGFPDELVSIPTVSENWFDDKSSKLELSDIVILSKLHSYIGTHRMKYLPRINSIPAFGKLRDNRLSMADPVSLSLMMLYSANKKVTLANNLFDNW